MSLEKFDVFLFDMDGTIVDSSRGITNGIAYALGKFGMNSLPPDIMRNFIGPPLIDSFMKYYKVDEKTAKQLVFTYREYYSERGYREIEPYPDLERLLKTLKGKGKTVSLATCKPEIFAKRIIEHLKLDKYFDAFTGAALDGTRDRKEDVILLALDRLGAKPESAIMIGDTRYDIDGAKATGVKSLAVLYGFGLREEIEKAGPNYIAGSISEIIDML